MKKLALLLLAFPAYGQVDLASQQRLAKPVTAYQEAQRQQAELELIRQQTALLEQERQARETEKAKLAQCAETRALVMQIIAKLSAQPEPNVEAIAQAMSLLEGC